MDFIITLNCLIARILNDKSPPMIILSPWSYSSLLSVTVNQWRTPVLRFLIFQVYLILTNTFLALGLTSRPFKLGISLWWISQNTTNYEKKKRREIHDWQLMLKKNQTPTFTIIISLKDIYIPKVKRQFQNKGQFLSRKKRKKDVMHQNWSLNVSSEFSGWTEAVKGHQCPSAVLGLFPEGLGIADEVWKRL